MIRGVSAKQFMRDFYREISDDNVFNGAAALGFYWTLAIFPAIILLMTVIPYLPIGRVDDAIMDLLGHRRVDAMGKVAQTLSQGHHTQAFALSTPVQQSVELGTQPPAHRGRDTDQFVREFVEGMAQATPQARS